MDCEDEVEGVIIIQFVVILVDMKDTSLMKLQRYDKG